MAPPTGVDRCVTLRVRPRDADLIAGGPQRWAWLPFFEAYFSNFIEGTESSVEEARRIAIDNEIPADRPADAHDVAATYRLASDAADSRLTPRDAGHFLEILRARHRVLMAARPEKRPGELKVKPRRRRREPRRRRAVRAALDRSGELGKLRRGGCRPRSV